MKNTVQAVMVDPVPQEMVANYGVVDCHGESLAAGESKPMFAVVEKPEPAKAPSNMSIVGRYVLSRISGRCWGKLPGPVMRSS